MYSIPNLKPDAKIRLDKDHLRCKLRSHSHVIILIELALQISHHDTRLSHTYIKEALTLRSQDEHFKGYKVLHQNMNELIGLIA